MGNGLHLVIDEKLRRHHDETKREKEPIRNIQHERIPDAWDQYANHVSFFNQFITRELLSLTPVVVLTFAKHICYFTSVAQTKYQDMHQRCS